MHVQQICDIKALVLYHSHQPWATNIEARHRRMVGKRQTKSTMRMGVVKMPVSLGGFFADFKSAGFATKNEKI